MDFATNFKRICDEKGTSPTRILVELGLSTNKLSLWSKGGMPKADVLIKIAQKLDCDIFDFFEGNEEIVPPQKEIANVEFALDEDEKDIIRLFRTLSRKQKHAFMMQAYEYEETILQDKEE